MSCRQPTPILGDAALGICLCMCKIVSIFISTILTGKCTENVDDTQNKFP